MFMIQAFPGAKTDSLRDLRTIIQNPSAMRSVEIRYSVPGQLTIIHGDGSVVVQSWDATKSLRLPMLPTCQGTVPVENVRTLIRTMQSERFLQLPRKSYVVGNGDYNDLRDLRIHSIKVAFGGHSALRSFSAGKFGDEIQQIPMQFAAVENALTAIKTKAIPKAQTCGLNAAITQPELEVGP